MNREESREELKKMLPDYLARTGRSTRANFSCPNTSYHKNGDKKPSCSYDSRRNTCHCFACNSDYDIVDLIKFDYNTEDTKEAFTIGYELFNINLHNESYTTKVTQLSKPEPKAQEPEPIKEYDFTEIVEKAHETLRADAAALNHLYARGLSDEIIDKYKLGYSPLGLNPLLKDYPELKTNSKKQGLYKYVLPYFDEDNRCNYMQLEISDRNEIDNYNGKYRKLTGLTMPLFNERYISKAEPVIFIVEGLYDALSIEELGGKAITLGGLGHRRFIQLCQKYKPNSFFIIGLDNEENENTNRIKAEIQEELNKLGIKNKAYCYIEKDANEDLINHREELKESIQNILKQSEESELMSDLEETKEAAAEDYKKTFAAYEIEQLRNIIKDNKEAKALSTGFKGLDKCLDGGIYTGLYVIGGISSIGKTSFCLQLADNLAEQGQDVLYFSLETSKAELMAKSISRCSYIEAEKRNKLETALTTRDILKGRYDNPERQQTFDRAITRYEGGSGQHIKFIVGETGAIFEVTEIEKRAEEYAAYNSSYPVVIVDYVQLLKAKNDRSTDKQNTDYNILELKKLSTKMPVICISSFNRESYTAPVNLASFKESGCIEYTSDVLLGLQYEGMDYDESDKEREKRVRELLKEQEQLGRDGKGQSIQVKVLKQRLFYKGDTVVEFLPKYNYYRDKNAKDEIDSGWTVVTNTEELNLFN